MDYSIRTRFPVPHTLLRRGGVKLCVVQGMTVRSTVLGSLDCKLSTVLYSTVRSTVPTVQCTDSAARLPPISSTLSHAPPPSHLCPLLPTSHTPPPADPSTSLAPDSRRRDDGWGVCMGPRIRRHDRLMVSTNYEHSVSFFRPFHAKAPLIWSVIFLRPTFTRDPLDVHSS